MTQSRKLKPNLDKKSTELLNLTVLQRIDPFVEELLLTVSHVAFYEFNTDTSQWSRKNVEGPLFVVKRCTQPRFKFVVMNRLNTDNLMENLMGNFEYEVKVPYLLYRNASQDVNGMWFYDRHECEEVGDLFGRILNAHAKVPTKSKVSSKKSEIEELEAVSTPSVTDGPLEQSSTASNVIDVPGDRSFVNFFNTAMNIGNAPNLPISQQPYHSTATTLSTQPQNIAQPTLQSRRSVSVLPTILENPEPNTTSKHLSDLVKPLSIFCPAPSSTPLVIPPIPSSMPTSLPLNPPGNLQRPYAAPLLQPFPTPPPPSLTPTSVLTPYYGPVLSREKVRVALQLLVQDNKFIDLVYQAMLNAHQS